jgi:type 1 fimbria pilin
MKNVIVILFAFVCAVSHAQIKATTADGVEVMLNENGTWHFVKQANLTSSDESSSSLYDCSNLITTEVDKVTGEANTSATDMLVVSKDGGANGFGIYILQGSRTIIMSIKAVGAGNCIDDDDTMNILFRDGSRMELVNNGDFNCKASFTQYFGGSFGKKRELQALTTKEVETIRVWTSDGYVEENFSSDQSKTLMHTLGCMANL